MKIRNLRFHKYNNYTAITPKNMNKAYIKGLIPVLQPLQNDQKAIQKSQKELNAVGKQNLIKEILKSISLFKAMALKIIS